MFRTFLKTVELTFTPQASWLANRYKIIAGTAVLSFAAGYAFYQRYKKVNTLEPLICPIPRVTKHSDFNQSAFYSKLAPYYSVGDPEKCKGLLLAWYISEMSGGDFISDMNHIAETMTTKKPLTREQIQRLECIDTLQRDSQITLYNMGNMTFELNETKYNIQQHSIKYFDLDADKNFAHDVIEMVDSAIRLSLQNEESLVCINPSSSKGSHIFGLFAKTSQNKTQIKCFDGNFGIDVVDNPTDARNNLVWILQSCRDKDNFWNPHGYFFSDTTQECNTSICEVRKFNKAP